MRIDVVLTVCILLEYVMWSLAQRDTTCQDEKGSYCRGIGQKKSLSRCYNRETRCCATCRGQRLNIPGCPYGDRASFCSSIGEDRPISDCYTQNATCCQTCNMFFSGNLACPYGDKLNWCSEIGSRYLVSSCYEQEDNCCDTCSRFKQNIPGCEFGDHEHWCPWISRSYCDTEPHVCCATCATFTTTKPTPTSPPTTTTTTTSTVASSTGPASRSTQLSFQNRTLTPRLQSPKSPLSDNILVTYTGSPGRPNNDTSLDSTSTVIYDKKTVIHSGENITPTKPLESEDLNNVTSSSNSSESSLDIICFNNSTHHRLRHDKHGGRHRSRDQHKLDIICRNVTTNSTRSTDIHYSNEAYFSQVPNTTIATDSKSDHNTTMHSSAQLTTSPKGNDFHGEKEFQEGTVFSSCSVSRSTGFQVLIECLFVIGFLW